MDKYGVIGFPVKHSLSPATHSAAFQALKITADYQPFEVPPEKLAEFMAFFRKNLKGMNVTIPHKETVMAYLDVIDEEAKGIGAVNTVLNNNGKLYGYNTDSPGAMMALHENLDEKEVTILGAGGASRALVYGVLKHGGAVNILNRHIERAIDLVEYFRTVFPNGAFHFGTPGDFDIGRTDILINTTPAGMSPHDSETPIPNLKEKLSGHHPLIMDIVYRPRFTRFIREAQESGCKVITGERMFLHQAALAFEIWTGQKAPIKIMEEAIMKNLE